MSLSNKVVWSEGLFLQPQHFQQQDRHFERYIEARCQALIGYSWGFTELELERDLLRRPELRGRLVVPVVGGLSGTGLEHPQALTDLVRDLGIADVVRFVPAQSQRELADWYCAASLVCVPSRSETFGLVALEAQACGTPVVAAGVGGLTTAVRDGRSGVLVDGHDPDRWARVISDLLASPDRLGALRTGALSHAGGFGWSRTAAETLEVYAKAAHSVWSERTAAPLASALP